jgi:hypothetical protein
MVTSSSHGALTPTPLDLGGTSSLRMAGFWVASAPYQYSWTWYNPKSALDSEAARARMPGKRVQFDSETWVALDLLARDRMSTFQELAEEAFRDLLKKYGRPTDLKTALRESVRQDPVASNAISKKPPKRS